MPLPRAPLCLLALLCFLAAKASAELVVAKLGGSVSFTLPRGCASGGVKLVTRDNSLTVAQLIRGVWTPGGGYGDRIRHVSPSEVSLTRVNYNDEDTFELLCAGSPLHVVQLETVRILHLKATKGDPLRLPCDSYTAKGAAGKPVRWEKDGEPLLELDWASGVNRTGASGLNVSEPAWRATGDASGILERVEPEDRGDYTCTGYDKGGKRRRVALRVTVEETETITCPTPPTPAETGTSKTTIITTVFVTVIVTVFVTVFVVYVFVPWVRGRTANAQNGAGDGDPAPQEGQNLTGSDPEAPIPNGHGL